MQENITAGLGGKEEEIKSIIKGREVGEGWRMGERVYKGREVWKGKRKGKDDVKGIWWL